MSNAFRGIGLFVAIALVACGGGTAPAAASATGASTASAAAATAKPLSKTSLNVMGTFYPYFTVLYVAEKQGFYKAEGLTVNLMNNTGNAQTATSALLGGSADIVSPGGTAVLVATAQGAGVKSIMTLGYGTEDQLVVNAAKAKALNMPSSDPDAQLKALKGSNLKLGFASAASDPALEIGALLKERGMTVGKDVQFSYTGTQAASVTAFQSGAIDGYAGTPPTPFQVPESSVVRVVYATLPMFAETFYRHVITTDAMIKDHPDTLMAFTRAATKAWDFIVKNPEKAKANFDEELAAYDIKDPALLTKLYDSELSVLKAKPGTPALTKGGFQKSVDLLNLTRAAANPPQPALQLKYENVVDNSFVEAAIDALKLQVPKS